MTMHSSGASARLVAAEDLAARQPIDPGFLHLPQAGTCFAERAMRLRQLAAGHAMGDYLRFMADLAEAQQAQLDAFPEVALPEGEALRQAALLGQPPLPAAHWPRDPAWQHTVHALALGLKPKAPAAAQAVLDRLAQAAPDFLEQQADKLLHGTMQGLDMAAAPLVAAALQVYWTHLVLAVHALPLPAGQPAAFGRIDDATVCPCCGTKPSASVVKTGGESSGQRYLHCALCGSQWHMVRIKCSHCQSTQGLAYHALELTGSDAAPDASRPKPVVQAETCDACGHYLKIVHADRDAQADPVADDLASITLDLLVSDAGTQRHGVNLLLLFGEPPDEVQAAAPPASGSV